MVTISSSLRLAHALHFRLHRSSWIHRVHFAWGFSPWCWEVVGGFNQPVWKILHKLDYCILLSFPVFNGEKKNTRSQKKNPRDPNYILHQLSFQCCDPSVLASPKGVFSGNYDIMDIFSEGVTFAAFPPDISEKKKKAPLTQIQKSWKDQRGCGCYLDVHGT